MSEIKPALTAERWARIQNRPRYEPRPCDTDGMFEGVEDDDTLCYAIALANASLPDDDPRKITRTDVNWIRGAASYLKGDSTRGQEWDTRLSRIADILASYLPPESGT